MKKSSKIFKMSLATGLTGLLFGLTNRASAFSLTSAQQWLSTGSSSTPITIQSAAGVFLPIGQILFTIAAGVLVIVGVIMGVKYMMASANDKANIKEKLIWYIVSIVVVTGGIGITGIIMNFFSDAGI